MLDLARYDYRLPGELIARSPATPRDSSRLFVYDTASDTVSFDIFRNIGKYLPPKTLLVLNDTKVVPARLWLTKETGGKVEVLLMVNELGSYIGQPSAAEGSPMYVKGIVDRKISRGAKLFFKSGAFLQVARQEEQFFFFKPSVPLPELFVLLESEGQTPIPPYIKNAPLAEHELRERYQSVFAKNAVPVAGASSVGAASVAAPTASLHFTPELLTSLEKQGVDRTEITLHVGMGTFAPIGEENFRNKKLFTEYYEVTEQAARKINGALSDGTTIIPVGTTACRTLESAVSHRAALCNIGQPYGRRATDIFIFPPYDFKVASGLITNFHIPKSSLMLLVDAFLGHKKARRNIQDLYKIAIGQKFRFYSFGDAMLIV